MIARLTDTPVIETARLTLRAPRMEDFEAWHDFTMSERSQFVRPNDPDLRMSWRAFAHVTGMWALRGFGLFVFCDKDNGKPLGTAGPWYPMEWPERELGWTVWSGAAEGKGYAFEAAQAARAYAYDTLGWTTAVSYIAPGNVRSIALAERLGCVPDTTAEWPGDDPIQVYRHPSPSERDSDGGMEAYS